MVAQSGLAIATQCGAGCCTHSDGTVVPASPVARRVQSAFEVHAVRSGSSGPKTSQPSEADDRTTAMATDRKARISARRSSFIDVRIALDLGLRRFVRRRSGGLGPWLR